MKNAARHLSRYAANLEKLTYDRAALSLAILEGDSRDDTFARLQAMRPDLTGQFARFLLFKRDYGFHMPPDIPRWAPPFQQTRRSILARCRNYLLMRALEDEDWVLWLDCDVIKYPPDIIEQLLSFRRDIVHPHCVCGPGEPTFDRNGWAKRGERHLEDYRGAGGPVRLSAVGGTMLLIRADLHREGLVFPPFPYGVESSAIRPQHPLWGKGEIETEGLGIMALDMGAQPWGLPDLEIIHAGGSY
jgi:hypothetical protein